MRRKRSSRLKSKGLLTGLLLVCGVAVVVAIAIRNATQYRGVAIEAFDMPQQLTENGVSGEHVARVLLARIQELTQVGGTSTVFGVKSIGVDWSNIAVSSNSLSSRINRQLRDWFGQQTRIHGEITDNGATLAINARVDEQSVGQLVGNADRLDALISQAADRVMEHAQPFQYAAALTNLGQADAAIAIYSRLAEHASTSLERAIAYAIWSYRLLDRSDYTAATESAQKAVELAPQLGRVYYRLWEVHYNQGHAEDALHDITAAELKLRDDPEGIYEAKPRLLLRAICACEVLLAHGDVQPENSPCQEAAAARNRTAVWQLPLMLALRHDLRAAAEAEAAVDTAQAVPMEIQQTYARRRSEAMGSLRLAREDWDGAIAVYSQGIVDAPSAAPILKPWLAYAMARKGDLAGAAKLLEALPNDCYACVRARGKIAALKKDWKTADQAFKDAAHSAPSLPWAFIDRSEALLSKGDAQGAVDQARAAIGIAPQLADAHAALAAALVKTGDSTAALAAYARAAELAPHWGRVHLEWASVLRGMGRTADAAVKIKIANGLELNNSERLLLAKATSSR